MIKLPSPEQITKHVQATFFRFPFAVTAALIGTGLGIYAIETSLDDDWIARYIFTASLATFFFTALALGCENINRQKRSLAMGIGAGLIAAYFWYFPVEALNLAGDKWWMRQIFLCLGSLVALTWIPYWNKPAENELIWEWNRRLISNFVVTVFFGIVLFAGIAAAFFAIDSLFGLDLDEEIYFETWIIIVGTFGPLFFLAHLPKNPQKIQIPNPIPAFMRVFTKYILTPLAIGYFLILYAYTAKILFLWEWPQNLLGWLVICFSAVAVFTYFLWTPYWKTKNNTKDAKTKNLRKKENTAEEPTLWKRIQGYFSSDNKIKSSPSFQRLFWWGLLPQIAMLFIAIAWRIQAYSVTENRYFIVVLGCWLLGISLYFLLCKKAIFKWVFAVLTLIIFGSQYGPLSGYALGERSQTLRLQKILTESKILQDGIIVPTKIELDRDTRFQISNITNYLIQRHGVHTVQVIFPTITTKIEADKKLRRYNLASDIVQKLGFDYVSEWEYRSESENQHFNFSVKWNAPRNIEGYHWHISTLDHYNQESQDLNGQNFRFETDGKDKIIKIFKDEVLWEKIDLQPFFEQLSNEPPKTKENIDPEELTYFFESEKMVAKVFFINIWGNSKKVESYNVQMYLRFKE